MASTEFHIGPTGRNPDYWRNEFQYANCVCDAGGATFSLVDAGGGVVSGIQIFIAPTTITMHDLALAGTPAAANTIVNLIPATGKDSWMPYTFSQGLQVVCTGASSFTVAFRGAPTLSARQFGVA